MRHELHVDLTTCALNLHVPRAKNAIRFVKERVRCIQSETSFIKYLRRLTIEMVKQVTVLINSFNRKPGGSSSNITQTNIVHKEIQDSTV